MMVTILSKLTLNKILIMIVNIMSSLVNSQALFIDILKVISIFVGINFALLYLKESSSREHKQETCFLCIKVISYQIVVNFIAFRMKITNIYLLCSGNLFKFTLDKNIEFLNVSNTF